MYSCFATAPRGLGDVLFDELIELGLKPSKPETGGVQFQASLPQIYKANLWLRCANRVLIKLAEFDARNEDQLYQNILKIDLEEFISADQNFMVDATVSSSEIRDQRILALKTKDALVDRFREKYGVRPNVEKEDPDLRIVISGHMNFFKVYADTSGEPLFKRGYRFSSTDAPLKETLAAGLLKLAGYKGKGILIDPFCGSGTILIEAALMALNSAPGLMRDKFGFENWLNFQADEYEDLRAEAENSELEETEARFIGYDIAKQAIQFAAANAKRAGVSNFLELQRQGVAELTLPEDTAAESVLIVTNPPYGIRIGGYEYEIRDAYRDFGFQLKANFQGAQVWVLAGNKEMTGEIKMKSEKKVFLYNGKIETRFLNYKVNKF